MSNFTRSLNTFAGGLTGGYLQGAESKRRKELVGMQTDVYERQKRVYQKLGDIFNKYFPTDQPEPSGTWGMNDRGVGEEPPRALGPWGMNDRGAGPGPDNPGGAVAMPRPMVRTLGTMGDSLDEVEGDYGLE